jgi:Na+-transporting methylmalonyl-CoA/oxaloacetate decarboxylase gamma subunit
MITVRMVSEDFFLLWSGVEVLFLVLFFLVFGMGGLNGWWS